MKKNKTNTNSNVGNYQINLIILHHPNLLNQFLKNLTCVYLKQTLCMQNDPKLTY